MLFDAAVDAGADDVQVDSHGFTVFTNDRLLMQVKSGMEASGYGATNAERTLLPKNVVVCDENTAVMLMQLIDMLEELDDVQKVYHNADPDSDALVALLGTDDE